MSGLELPEFVIDHLGREVRVGDQIAYATLLGRSADVSVSEVLGFQWSKSDSPVLKIRVRGTHLSMGWRDMPSRITQKEPSSIHAGFRRFVKLEPAE